MCTPSYRNLTRISHCKKKLASYCLTLTLSTQ